VNRLYSGRPLLHLLAAQGKPEQVMILLAGGADGTLRSIGGHVAFDLAKHNSSVKEDGGLMGVKCGPVLMRTDQAWRSGSYVVQILLKKRSAGCILTKLSFFDHIFRKLR
jgi:hypothetical protein